MILGRALAVYGCCALFARSRSRLRRASAHSFLGWVARGVALALVLGLPAALPQRETLITVTFAVVAFSVIVQGMTVTPLLRPAG